MERKNRAIGIPLGISLGVALGVAFGETIGNVGKGIGYGMAIGVVVGIIVGAARWLRSRLERRRRGDKSAWWGGLVTGRTQRRMILYTGWDARIMHNHDSGD